MQHSKKKDANSNHEMYSQFCTTRWVISRNLLFETMPVISMNTIVFDLESNRQYNLNYSKSQRYCIFLYCSRTLHNIVLYLIEFACFYWITFLWRSRDQRPRRKWFRTELLEQDSVSPLSAPLSGFWIIFI